MLRDFTTALIFVWNIIKIKTLTYDWRQLKLWGIYKLAILNKVVQIFLFAMVNQFWP